MKNILLTISYDGTDFCGWQRQDTAGEKYIRTVQGEIENALEKLFQKKITLYGSGRTDSGVHAIAQAANFISPIDSIPEKNYIRALNSFLPYDIRITNAEEKPEFFNARFSATSRIYRYFIFPTNNKFPNAIENRFMWACQYQPNIENLNEMAKILKGEMDCASFASKTETEISTFRYLDNARFFFMPSWFGENDVLVFEIEANAFLWKMVRTVVGTLIALDKKNRGADDLKKIIDSHERKFALLTAPPKGLFLYKVKFDGVRRHNASPCHTTETR